MNDELLTPNEVAKIFKVSSRTVVNMIRDGKLNYIIIGGEKRKSYRIYRGEIERFAAEEYRKNNLRNKKTDLKNKIADLKNKIAGLKNETDN